MKSVSTSLLLTVFGLISELAVTEESDIINCSEESNVTCVVHRLFNDGCRKSELIKRFPDLYKTEKHQQAIPSSFSLNFFRRDRKLGINLKIKPPNSREDVLNVTGYEIMMINGTNNSTQCFILETPSSSTSSKNKTIKMRLFPIIGIPQYDIYRKLRRYTFQARSLPRLINRTDLCYSKNIYVNVADSVQVLLSNHWMTSIAFSKDSSSRSIEAYFERPPSEFHFTHFLVNLRRKKDNCSDCIAVPYKDMSVGLKEAYYHFTNLEPGEYYVEAEPETNTSGVRHCKDIDEEECRCLLTISDSIQIRDSVDNSCDKPLTDMMTTTDLPSTFRDTTSMDSANLTDKPLTDMMTSTDLSSTFRETTPMDSANVTDKPLTDMMTTIDLFSTFRETTWIDSANLTDVMTKTVISEINLTVFGVITVALVVFGILLALVWRGLKRHRSCLPWKKTLITSDTNEHVSPNIKETKQNNEKNCMYQPTTPSNIVEKDKFVYNNCAKIPTVADENWNLEQKQYLEELEKWKKIQIGNFLLDDDDTICNLSIYPAETLFVVNLDDIDALQIQEQPFTEEPVGICDYDVTFCRTSDEVETCPDYQYFSSPELTCEDVDSEFVKQQILNLNQRYMLQTSFHEAVNQITSDLNESSTEKMFNGKSVSDSKLSVQQSVQSCGLHESHSTHTWSSQTECRPEDYDKMKENSLFYDGSISL